MQIPKTNLGLSLLELCLIKGKFYSVRYDNPMSWYTLRWEGPLKGFKWPNQHCDDAYVQLRHLDRITWKTLSEKKIAENESKNELLQKYSDQNMRLEESLKDARKEAEELKKNKKKSEENDEIGLY